MIIAHVTGTNLNTDIPHFEHEEFDNADCNSSEVQDCFYAMQAKGYQNINIVCEDTQVSEDSAMPELRYTKPYTLVGGGYPELFVFEDIPELAEYAEAYEDDSVSDFSRETYSYYINN